jgi:DNA invertase Pin-like site-specific DNA recombinase
MTLHAYLRVSTDAQDEKSQTQIIAEWSAKTGRTVGFFHSDTASGSVPWEKRQIGAVLAGLEPGDGIIVSEISRIARSQLGVLSFLQAAQLAGVEVIAVRSGIALDNSMSSKIVISILALAGEIERDLIRERTKAALAARKQAGLPLGRPRGSRSVSILAHKGEDIKGMLAARVSKRAIARLLGCSPDTLYAFLRNEVSATGDTMTKPLFPEEA